MALGDLSEARFSKPPAQTADETSCRNRAFYLEMPGFCRHGLC